MRQPGISESICQVCDGINPVWFAPNELWNKVMRYPDGREESEKINFICPNCFIQEAIKLELAPRVWRLSEADETGNDLADERRNAKNSAANPQESPTPSSLREQIRTIKLPKTRIYGNESAPFIGDLVDKSLENQIESLATSYAEAARIESHTKSYQEIFSIHMAHNWNETSQDLLDWLLKEGHALRRLQAKKTVLAERR